MAKGKSKKGSLNSGSLSTIIVVKFRDYMNIPYTSDTEMMDYLKQQFSPPLVAMLNKYQEVTIGRLITSITPLQIDTLVAEAAINSKKWDETYKSPNLHNYLKIECNQSTPVLKLLNMINDQKIVEDVFIQGESTPASSPPKGKSLIRRQGYLNAAPHGINAKYAWRHGGDGSGNFKFIDIEDGWDFINTQHNDLPDRNTVPLIHGLNAGSLVHGNQVLGVILGKDNGTGVKGIAPAVNASVVSQYPIDIKHQNPANAVAYASAQLQSGDILLLELQYAGLRNGLVQPRVRNDFPLEYHPCVFHLIKNATLRGVIVVEAAGNTKQSLDTFKYFDRDTHDSGAIMVAAGKSALPHNRYFSSNYGSRIDCYAWGEKIATTKDNNGFSFNFMETSGAAAIIAGAAISVQSMNIAKTGNKLDSKEMRLMLKDETTGTLSPDPKFIGVMPDLKKIAKKIIVRAAASAAAPMAPVTIAPAPVPPTAHSTTAKVLKPKRAAKKKKTAVARLKQK